jgi:hypothetical protein
VQAVRSRADALGGGGKAREIDTGNGTKVTVEPGGPSLSAFALHRRLTTGLAGLVGTCRHFVTHRLSMRTSAIDQSIFTFTGHWSRLALCGRSFHPVTPACRGPRFFPPRHASVPGAPVLSTPSRQRAGGPGSFHPVTPACRGPRFLSGTATSSAFPRRRPKVKMLQQARKPGLEFRVISWPAIAATRLYSSRSRAKGSSDRARSAGIHVARTPTAAMARTTPASTSGSRGVA